MRRLGIGDFEYLPDGVPSLPGVRVLQLSAPLPLTLDLDIHMNESIPTWHRLPSYLHRVLARVGSLRLACLALRRVDPRKPVTHWLGHATHVTIPVPRESWYTLFDGLRAPAPLLTDLALGESLTDDWSTAPYPTVRFRLADRGPEPVPVIPLDILACRPGVLRAVFDGISLNPRDPYPALAYLTTLDYRPHSAWSFPAMNLASIIAQLPALEILGVVMTPGTHDTPEDVYNGWAVLPNRHPRLKYASVHTGFPPNLGQSGLRELLQHILRWLFAWGATHIGLALNDLTAGIPAENSTFITQSTVADSWDSLSPAHGPESTQPLVGSQWELTWIHDRVRLSTAAADGTPGPRLWLRGSSWIRDFSAPALSANLTSLTVREYFLRSDWLIRAPKLPVAPLVERLTIVITACPSDIAREANPILWPDLPIVVPALRDVAFEYIGPRLCRHLINPFGAPVCCAPALVWSAALILQFIRLDLEFDATRLRKLTMCGFDHPADGWHERTMGELWDCAEELEFFEKSSVIADDENGRLLTPWKSPASLFSREIERLGQVPDGVSLF
jgi:hypothetical protein